MTIRFAEPLWLLLFPLLAFLLWRRCAATPWPGVANFPAPARPSWRWRFRSIPGLLWAAAVLAMVVALCRPMTSLPPRLDHRDGLALVFLVDVSGSMGMEDAGTDARKVSRLDAVRPFVRRVMATRPNDRLAIVAFARTARVACPLTADQQAALAMLDPLSVDVLDNKTNLGDAIVLGLGLLKEAEATASGRLIVCSDGAHNVAEGTGVATAARLAEAVGVPVHAVELGRGGRPKARETLARLAELTGGRKFVAESAADLEQLAQLLAQVDPSPQPVPRPSGWRDQTRVTLVLALVLLVVGGWWHARWWREPPPLEYRG